MSNRQFALITTHVNRLTAMMRFKLFSTEEQAWDAIDATEEERKAGLAVIDYTEDKYTDKSESWVCEVVNGELTLINLSLSWLNWRAPERAAREDYRAFPDIITNDPQNDDKSNENSSK